MNLLNMSEGAYLAMHSLALVAARQPERLTVKQLAQELEASQAHLAKVFQKLSKAGLVTSVRGPSGGFILDREPEDISFLDIYEIIEGKVEKSDCPLGKSHCAFDSCILTDDFNRIADDLYNMYEHIKLSNFK
ncbi:MAG: Rrf2 family transcriptional regulator [Spirochaetales bacterium]|uniref:Rrf2 family transcriptional regulator n=1 Tax=Candidatus Thalassospirochaeta sargassi TaxID=3119039 RepID=A0AAJ1IA81_9SPIO|nr:Rrf2 family transcriptional regulator [Spirochaetales bacterium]